MKEALWAILGELKRLRSEGEEALCVDEDAFASLAKFARAAGGQEVVETPEEIRFAKDVEISLKDEAKKTREAMPGKIKIVVKNRDFEIDEIPAPKPFSLPDGSKREKWEALREIVLNDEVCNAHLRPGKNVVFGVGNLDADIFFCGEAPGADEEIQGEPFVGKAGQLLTKIIKAMGLGRENVYIGNIITWRPEIPTKTVNRPPTPEEMAYCLPYLKAQIDIVKPKAVVALGMTAVNGLLGADPKRKMGSSRGVWHKFNGIDLMITYHPSFLLQYASPEKKRL
ncbi:MAG: uracil-DNA glycosylase, partial [Opitutales bacterium]|nr:uracil-DNA glycosylase [Opitutales bacterium]